jgi:hypothetical protein
MNDGMLSHQAKEHLESLSRYYDDAGALNRPAKFGHAIERKHRFKMARAEREAFPYWCEVPPIRSKRLQKIRE